jgi:hypothetical protein
VEQYEQKRQDLLHRSRFPTLPRMEGGGEPKPSWQGLCTVERNQVDMCKLLAGLVLFESS